VNDFKRIAFFDFDGTITSKDTLTEVIKFQKGNFSFYIGILLNTPWLIVHRLGLISNDAAKQRLLKYFFGGMKAEDFQRKCDDFASTRLTRLIRPEALEEIRKLKAENTEIVIVSASAENWIGAWSDSLLLKLVSTSLEVKDGRMTGRIEGKNCYGQEKVRRIRERWNLDEFGEIYAYGDSASDKPMLALATKSFYKPFTP
jgi:HAD superfamily hydrolase (TIGR01490 family)